MYRKISLFVILIALQSSCAVNPADSDPDSMYYVSLARVIVEPEPFVGYNITVVGFLSEMGDILFLSEDHARAVDIATAVYVNIEYQASDEGVGGISSTGCEWRFVRVFGHFTRLNNGEYFIKSVYKILATDPDVNLGIPYECWSNPAAAPAK